MGSYASQTNETERWEIVQHVMNLKASLEGHLLVPQTEEVAAMPMESEATPSEEEH